MKLISPEVVRELQKDSRVYINDIGDIYFHSNWVGNMEYELDTGKILLYLAANSKTTVGCSWDRIETCEYAKWLNSVHKKLDLKPITHPIDYCNGKYNIVEILGINKP